MRNRTWSGAALVAASLLAAACADGSAAPGGGQPPDPAGAAEPTVLTTTTDDVTTAGSNPPATGSSPPGASETLVIWADEPRAVALRSVAAEFAETTGVKVHIELVPMEEMRTRVELAIPTGDGPDIFVGPHDWSGDLVARELIAPVDIDAARDQFLQVALDAFNLGGRIYGVPYTVEAVALYRNTTAVVSAPATWDDLTTACDRATTAQCLVVPGGGEWSDAYHNFSFVSAFGGDVFGFDEATGFDPSTLNLDTPEVVRGVEFLEQQVAAGTIPATHYDSSKQLFLDGEAAFWITGPWELAELHAQDVVVFDVSLIPRIGSDPVRPFVGAEGFFVSARSERPAIAAEFLLDAVATDDTMRHLVAADPQGTAWRSLRGALPGSQHLDTFVASAVNGVPMPNLPEMGAVWGPLGDNLQLVRNGELSAADAMSATAAEIRAELSD